jgi:diaminohydroxyphosphoribosylaminopyrimidine deaminase/5-amino-6-(5-phosphoribosylamino)uracil reductase
VAGDEGTAIATQATEQDDLHLRRALELARRGRGAVSPNPLVGAVVARGGRVIGEGFHAELGGLHAERAALEDCRARGEDPAGAEMFVTLEPCAHHGRQPPCADAVLEAGIGRLVYASEDPSEKASGRGPGMLRDGGVTVEAAAGQVASDARLLNQPFRKHTRTGRPLVTLKMAMSLDGRVATRDGDSKWISGEESRALVHSWRAAADAIAVGIGTAVADDPLLTARGPDARRQPLRVVFDASARLPGESRLMDTAEEVALVLVTAPGLVSEERFAELRGRNVEVLVASGETHAEQVHSALDILGRHEVTSLLLEGGPTLAGAFIAAGEVDELSVFVAPLLLGGGRPASEGDGPPLIAESRRALAVESRQVGDDVLIQARFREW